MRMIMKPTISAKFLSVFAILLLFYSCTVNRQFIISDSDARIIGEVEPVTIKKAKMTLPARIDTGAKTSSIDAKEITQFERDGKKWVRFTLEDRKTGKKVELDSRLVRISEIKRHGKKSQERTVVELGITLGPVEQVCEFSLTDRSKYDYQVLIGRNILQGEFVVDVSQKNTSSPISEKKDNEK